MCVALSAGAIRTARLVAPFVRPSSLRCAMRTQSGRVASVERNAPLVRHDGAYHDGAPADGAPSDLSARR